MISGKGRHGKDSTADILMKKLEGKSTKVAIARDLKLICSEYLGWDGIKSEDGREMLQQIGTDKIRKEMKWDAFHVHRTYETIKIIEDYFDYIFVCDVRFKNEIHYLSAMFPEKVVSIKVNRLNFKSPLTLEQQQHESETNLDDFDKFDYYISSHSGLDNLEQAIDNILQGILY